MEDVANLDERLSVTNTILGGKNQRKTSTISMYLKPTTMRGIPLANLTPSSIMRGFYITRGENDLPSSILADGSTPHTTTNSPVGQQTEPTLISDISTTDETVTVTHNDGIESGPNALDDNVNDIVNDKIDGREERYSTFGSSVIFSRDAGSAENLSSHEKSDLITISIDRPASKRGKSLRKLDHTTPLSNSYVSSTTPTRRKIALAVSRYNDATTPLWTGRRIVAKKRIRTTISPIKDAIRQAESDSSRAVTSIPRSAFLTAKPASALISGRRKPLTTAPTIPLIVPDSTASSEILNVHDNLARTSNDTKTEEPESHTTVEAAVTSTNSINTTPSISKTISATNDPTNADISTFSDDPTTILTIPAIANAPTTIAVAKAPAVTTDATITTTSAITSIGDESTSLSYSVTDNPTIENTNAILSDSAATIAFVASTESEITSTNTVPENVLTIATDPVTGATVASTGIETSTLTDYSTVAIANTVNAQKIAIDSASTTTAQITDADRAATSTIANHSTIPTTINTHDVTTDAVSITAASAEVETTSTIGDYSTFTTTAIKDTTIIPVTTIPVTITTSPLTTVISSIANTRHVHAIAPMTTSNLADANTVTASMITTTTPLSVVIPITITDLKVITSANANIPSTSATSETSPIMIPSKTSSVTSSKAPVTSTVVTSTSAAPTTLTTEFSTIHLANPNNLDISGDSEILAVTATAESTQTTEIPTTFETPPIFTSAAIAYPKPLDSTNFEASSTVTAALSSQGDKTYFTPKVTPTPSTLHSIAASITDETTVALERSTTFAMPSAIFGETITTNPTIQTTTNADSVRTTSEESTMPEGKTGFKEETQGRTEDQIIMTINKPSFARTSEKSTTSEMKTVSEGTTSKTVENRKRNQTTSELDTSNYQFSQKTARRRVLNRTNNWLGSPVTLQRTSQYPRHRVALYRGRSRRPSAYISSSKMTEKNHRRRIVQKKIRVNSEAFNSTVRPDQDIVDVQNTTEDHTDRVENVTRMKVALKKIKERVEEETTTILPTEETTVFLQSSTAIENEMLRVHHEDGNIEEKQKMLKEIEHSQESFTTKETSTSFNSTNDSLPDNSQSNFHVAEDLSELEKLRNIMKVVLKNVTSRFEEKNPIEEASADSDSINTNLQDNFSKSSYADKNLSDKKITGRRMRVVLKSVRPKSEEKNSTTEETNVEPDSTDKNLRNNLSNNVNISQNFSNEKKTKRRMRVVLKRVQSKSEKEGTKTEEASTEHDSTDESLQGTFSNNFYSAKNLPIEYGSKRRMRVVLKSVKPKSAEKNSTIEETSVNPDSTNENLQGTFSSNFHSDKNFPVKYGTRRRTRVILKSVKLKSEKENSTFEETSVDPDSINKSFQSTFLNNSRRGKNLSAEYRTKRRMRVVLKSVKPKSEERNSTIEETSVNSDSTDKDLQGSFSSNLHESRLSDEGARKKAGAASKSVVPKSKERDSAAEETSADSDFARRDPQALYTFHFSSNLHVGDNLPDKKTKHSKSEEKGTMTERPEDREPQTTRTSVPAEEDTDRPSHEVTNGGSVSRNPGSGHSNRHRKPTPFTTVAPLTNTLLNTFTVHRRGRPVETTLSPRIDFVDAFEDTESYVKPAGVLHDQNADVSDQSTRAQEFAVTLSDPPSSSTDIGRTPLKDADRRKISTTIAPRTDPTTSRTVARYDANLRSRQRPRAKDRPTVNATTRPRRPPVIDYDYYEDEAPIIVDKSLLSSKLFLTSKGTVRCLDQGNFPHPYSCKKFITCARMVNGEVIGTEYTCPDRLSFDPVGGICNWSAGLGCKD